jgi:hypothetical protein
MMPIAEPIRLGLPLRKALSDFLSGAESTGTYQFRRLLGSTTVTTVVQYRCFSASHDVPLGYDSAAFGESSELQGEAVALSLGSGTSHSIVSTHCKKAEGPEGLGCEPAGSHFFGLEFLGTTCRYAYRNCHGQDKPRVAILRRLIGLVAATSLQLR